MLIISYHREEGRERNRTIFFSPVHVMIISLVISGDEAGKV